MRTPMNWFRRSIHTTLPATLVAGSLLALPANTAFGGDEKPRVENRTPKKAPKKEPRPGGDKKFNVQPAPQAKIERAEERREERTESRRAARLDAFETRFDADGDGKLSDEEKSAAAVVVKDRCEKAKMRIDANGDGKISRDEWRAAHPNFPYFDDELNARMKNPKAKLEFFKRFDKNIDGRLDDEEKAAARAAWEQKRFELIARFDANGDGRLDYAERNGATEALRAERESEDKGTPAGTPPAGESKPEQP